MLIGPILPICPDDSTSGRCYFLSVINQQPHSFNIHLKRRSLSPASDRVMLCTVLFLSSSAEIAVCLEKVVAIWHWLDVSAVIQHESERRGRKKMAHMGWVWCIFFISENRQGESVFQVLGGWTLLLRCQTHFLCWLQECSTYVEGSKTFVHAGGAQAEIENVTMCFGYILL